ncbi:MAG TPA: MFS transporter [Stellaceae bacterium]|nr:MFS transporter [Stellaceae bacterium]
MAQPIVLRSRRDVVELINQGAVGQTRFWIVLIAIGGTFIDAYDFTSLGIGAIQLRQEFQLTPAALGLITASMAIGALFGALFGGYYVDKVGRLRMFLLDLIFFVISAIGAALAPNYYVLILFRLLMGVGVGLDFPVALSFVAEYTTTSGKAKYVNWWGPTWFIATIAGFVAILPFYFAGVGTSLWRWAVGLGALPALVILVLRFIYMEESPMWAAHQSLEEAARVLRKMYGLDVVVAADAEAPAGLAEVYSLRNFAKIFSPAYRSRAILVAVIGAMQSLEYYAVAFYFPVISTTLFGQSLLRAISASLLFNLFGLAGGLWLVFWASTRLGARTLTIIGLIGVIASLLVVGLGYGHLPPVLVFVVLGVFLCFHSFGQGSQGMTMATLSFPTSIRGAGTGWAQGMLRVGSTIGFFFFPLVREHVGLGATLLLLVVVPLISLVTTLSIRWEPVGADVDAEDFLEPVGAPPAPRAQVAG